MNKLKEITYESQSFTNKDKKSLLEHFDPFSIEDYRRIITESSRILMFAAYRKNVKHITVCQGKVKATRRIIQPYIMSLDERLDYELDYTPISTLKVCASIASDRAFLPIFAAIEASSNALIIEGNEVFHCPVSTKNPELKSYNIFTKENCYIEEFTPRYNCFKTHWERPRINSLKGVVRAAKEFVYDTDKER